MKVTVLVALFTVFSAAVFAETTEPSTCEDIESPDPVVSPDGFGQAVGERGESNAENGLR